MMHDVGARGSLHDGLERLVGVRRRLRLRVRIRPVLHDGYKSTTTNTTTLPQQLLLPPPPPPILLILYYLVERVLLRCLARYGTPGAKGHQAPG